MKFIKSPPNGLKFLRHCNARAVGRILILILATGLISYGVSGLRQKHRATHNPQPMPSPNQTITATITDPDETPIDPEAAYHVAADQPRQIKLPTINARGLIQKVGLDKQGAMATPSNVTLAGWYSLGPRPGEPGVSVIDGHVQGKYQPGIFKKLVQLQVGDRFSVEFGNHSVKHFAVVSVHNYSPAELSPKMFALAPSLNRQLNLITCSGRYNPQNRQYERRTLVISRPL